MGQIDQYAQPVAGLHQPHPGPGQARPGIGRSGKVERHAMAKDVLTAPDRAEAAQPGGMKDMQLIQPRANALASLQMQDRGNRPRAAGGFDFGRAVAKTDRIGPRRRHADQDGGLFQRDAMGLVHADRRIGAIGGHRIGGALFFARHPHGEEPAAKAPGAAGGVVPFLEPLVRLPRRGRRGARSPHPNPPERRGLPGHSSPRGRTADRYGHRKRQVGTWMLLFVAGRRADHATFHKG